MKETEPQRSDQLSPSLFALGTSSRSREPSWSAADGSAGNGAAAVYYPGNERGAQPASLGFIGAALRRTTKIWCTLAAVGLALGVGLSIALPSTTRAATASVIIGMPPGSLHPLDATHQDQGLIQSRTVAAAALRQLGLRQSPSSFLTEYTTTVDTTQIIDVTARAPSAALAVREANAVASSFVMVQAKMLQSQQQLMQTSLQAPISQAQNALNALNTQIGQLSAEEFALPDSYPIRAELTTLQAESNDDTAALTALTQTSDAELASAEATTAAQIRATRVLDPAVAAAPASAKKRLLLFGGAGLLGGLVVGMAIVIIGALTSGRLRRRDDVAVALGAPVRLSVSRRALSSVRTRGLAGKNDPAVQRIVAHLHGILSPGRDGPARLAVVPVDDSAIPALCVTSLAITRARQGSRVVLADLCDDAPVARLLRVKGTGVRTVTVGDVRLTVATPEGDPVTIPGPLDGAAPKSDADRLLVDACASADLLVTLVPLDPSTGSDHLRGWADRAVPMVTAGRSSAERIHAVGEMIRIAGVRPASAVLLGADTSDESLGVVADPEADWVPRQDVQAKTVLLGRPSPAVPGPSSAQPEPG